MKYSIINAALLAASFITPLSATTLDQTIRLYFSYELKPEEKPGNRFWNNTTPLGKDDIVLSTGFSNPNSQLVGVLEFKTPGEVKTFQWSRNSLDKTLLKDCEASVLADPGVTEVAWLLRESHAVGNGVGEGALPGAFTPDTDGPSIDGVQVTCKDAVQ